MDRERETLLSPTTLDRLGREDVTLSEIDCE